MNKMMPLNASPALKAVAKNEAKVNATRDRFARSINFSAYSFCWYSLISIGKSIPCGLCYVKHEVRRLPGDERRLKPAATRLRIRRLPGDERRLKPAATG